jgi:Zn-dependent protease
MPEDERTTESVTTVGRVFSTPVVVKARTWLPVTQLAAWAIMTWLAGRKHPDWPCWKRLGTGALSMMVILGSEWCHNLAHAAAASLIGKPMDALRVIWGMPRVIYHDINDESVSPRQHIFRALGGPLCNASLFPLALGIKQFTQPASAAREIADAAVGMNAFLCSVSLLPIPGIDGGPILKWSLVERGHTPQAADEVVKSVNRFLGGVLGIAAGVELKKRRWFAGGLLGLLSALSLLIGFGILREQEQ